MVSNCGYVGVIVGVDAIAVSALLVLTHVLSRSASADNTIQAIQKSLSDTDFIAKASVNMGRARPYLMYGSATMECLVDQVKGIH